MDIVLVPVGELDLVTLDMLKDDLRKILQKGIRVGKGLSEPGYASNLNRLTEIDSQCSIAAAKRKGVTDLYL